MTIDILIFDLDGTISDPKQGIVRSMNHALAAHGYQTRSEDEIASYIGPPLDKIFMELVGSKQPSLILDLVATFRQRYAEVGYSENRLYAGMRETLDTLKSEGKYRLGVCTSKRVDFASKILVLFDLLDHFDFVDGGDVGIEKWQQLEALKEQGVITDQSLMIGDRYVDLTAAHKNGLKSAGVLWGYGSQVELEAHSPAYLFSKPKNLAQL
ncbi:HAD family hydrolase [Photobacterium sp. DNB23_23_1]|uniref:HAD hydrolase-like protein n=1 Tax=Photobacterium pectinilyticum TaxID=2906793 RepID=A0ABT1N1X4_9GAMM|nr:HAD hydrolase-like protein [Photobacterium sp. ZSDE20]MCQ1058740.1 HAD hydrolase-like protein [Photobacterium sp. ZSDE20]MDD1823522.1 HAD hydrolase-like protein [Photobacterium sp. ZSDE20]